MLTNTQVTLALSFIDRASQENKGWRLIPNSTRYALMQDIVDRILADPLLVKDHGGRAELMAVRGYFGEKKFEFEAKEKRA